MLRMYSIDYKKYPFLANIQEFIERMWPGLTIIDLLKSRRGVVYERALDMLKNAIRRGRINTSPRLTTEEEVIAYNLAQVIIGLLGNKWLRERFAIAVSKHAYEMLKREEPACIEAIGRSVGVDIRYDPVKCPRIPVVRRGMITYRIFPFSIYFKDYLRASTRLINDPKYALINQIVDHGRVYVDKDVAIRVLAEAITMHIRNKIRVIDTVPPDIRGIIEELKKELGLSEEAGSQGPSTSSTSNTYEQPEQYVVGREIIFNAFPPCMKQIVEQLKRGENLSHHARFAIAAFLSRIGMDVDGILELFRNAPDFNERIARYQIEHIAGLRGSRKQYMPYGCSTMKSLGLCPLTDSDCGVKNPLVAYMRAIRSPKKDKEKSARKNMKAHHKRVHLKKG